MEDMRLLKIFFVTGAYFYAVPVLLQYGYISYFNIPSSFIEASIRDNITVFFDFFRGILRVPFSLLILLVILIIISIFILGRLRMFDGWMRGITLTAITIISLFVFYNLGGKTAKQKNNFQIVNSSCINGVENLNYIIPFFSRELAVITPITVDENKLTGDFFVRDMSSLECEIQTQEIGPIIKE